MSRDIRFKAWDKYRKEFTGSLCPRIDSISKDIHSDRYDLLQSTGLKNKNGTDIFEGAGQNRVVIWNDKNCRFEFARNLGCKSHHRFDMIGGLYGFEVTGNIYENSELLGDK